MTAAGARELASHIARGGAVLPSLDAAHALVRAERELSPGVSCLFWHLTPDGGAEFRRHPGYGIGGEQTLHTVEPDETDPAVLDAATHTATTDEASSVRRQHRIDTGHYLTPDGSCPCDQPTDDLTRI